MRDPQRIPRMLEKLRIHWEKNPDFRLGQLIENYKQASRGSDIDTFSVEDNLIEEGMEWLSNHGVL